jgi:outer membrane protein insertion porin family
LGKHLHRHTIRLAAAAVIALAGTSGALGQPVGEENREPKQPTIPKPAAAPGTMSTMDNLVDRPVRGVKLVGLVKTDTQLVQNQIRTRSGQPLNPETVREDVQRLNRLGRFKEINARAQQYDDGSVEISFEFTETPVVRAVDIVGNRQLTNAEISPLVNLLKDTPVDEFQLGAARAAIERLYRDKGYFQATVTIDQKELEQGTVLFKVAEGERVRVTDIRFEGNNAFKAKQLTPHIKTTTAGIFETGPVDPEQLDKDVAALVEFYHDRGYLDVRADKQVVFAPNGKEAIVKFVLEEGPLYTLRSIKAELFGDQELRSGKSPTVISEQQIAGLMEIKAGDVYGVEKVKRSIDIVKNAYARMGYVGETGQGPVVRGFELRDPASPVVDLLVMVHEGEPYKTGLVTVKGNTITQKSVIMREITDIKPDRPLDLSRERIGPREITDAERRISETNLFDPQPGSTKLTLQPEDPANPGHRDVLLEVLETNTGSLSFGVGAGSDSGLIGLLSLKQRNFDITDTPDSFGETFSGRAFRGAGQEFDITLAPGTEVQNYSIGLSDPYLFDTDYSGSAQGFFFKRQYDQYDEGRLGARFSIGRRFGERWVGSISARIDNVDITNIAPDAPNDLFEVEGNSVVSGLSARLQRTSVDSRVRPTKGSRILAEVERVGALGGDYDFTRLTLEHQVFIPVYESFLGYRTVLSWKTTASYIPEGSSSAPIFERLYLGGRTFRGFKFRTVSPKGIRHDTGELGTDPIGGTWSFFTGVELQQPLYQDIVSGVVFIDSGTVTNTPGFSEYRISTGVGIRIAVPQLGPVPLAFDFGFPLLKQEGDQKRIFSFTLDVPFN